MPGNIRSRSLNMAHLSGASRLYLDTSEGSKASLLKKLQNKMAMLQKKMQNSHFKVEQETLQGQFVLAAVWVRSPSMHSLFPAAWDEAGMLPNEHWGAPGRNPYSW